MAKPPSEIVETTDQLPIVTGDEFEGWEGYGFENQTNEDYSIPFIQLLQALSPRVVEDPDTFKPGQIVNSVTGQIYDGKTGLCIIPVATTHQYVEWIPTDMGGGFVGTHEINSDVVKQAKAQATKFGDFKHGDNDLVETFSVYVLVLEEDGTFSNAVIAFTSTKIKKYKNWITKAKTIQIQRADGRRISPPLFAHKYRLKSVGEKNKKGQPYFNFAEITFDGENAMVSRLSPKDEVFIHAAVFNDLVISGQTKVNYDSVAGDSANYSEDEAVTGKPVF